MPGHRAVLQRDDPVRHAGVDQCLGTDDAAGAAAAIDHDKGVGRRDQLVKPIDQFGAGHADGAGDAVRMVFLVGAAVEDHHVAALPLPPRQFLGADPRRAHFVLDDLGEGLARHVHPAVDREARRRPGRHPAGQDLDIAPAAGDQPRRRALGEPAAAGVIVADDDRRRSPRQQGRGHELEPAQGQARRHQQMPVVKAPLLARIDDRDLAAIAQPPAQLCRRDPARCCRHLVLPRNFRGSVCPNSSGASKAQPAELYP